MIIANYMYYFPQGTVAADTNHNVPLNDRFVAVNEGRYTREENTFDGSVTWYDTTGKKCSKDQLPWVRKHEEYLAGHREKNIASHNAEARKHALADRRAMCSSEGLTLSGHVAKLECRGSWGNVLAVVVTRPDGSTAESLASDVIAAHRELLWNENPALAPAARIYARLAAALAAI